MHDTTQNPAAGQADKAGNQQENKAQKQPSVTAAQAGAGGWTPDTTTWEGMEEFLGCVMGPAWDTAQNDVWTTGFESVASGEKWHGRAGLAHLRAKFGDAMDADLYFAIGLMRAGAAGRSNNEVAAQALLIVDDIGTKVKVEDWEARFAAGCPRPSAQIETSPGNETWIWALDGDAKDPQRWADLALVRAWLVDARLTDEVMDPARYIRLPGGHNSKPKYRGPNGDGVPPRVRLMAWRMGQDGSGRVDLDAVARAVVGDRGSWGTGVFGDWRDAKFPDTASGRGLMTSAQVGAALGAGALVRTADLGKPDALLRLAVEVGMNPEQKRAGVVEALCPNMAAHTTRAETGFAFLGGGLMHCNHASCQGLATADFRALMLARMDEKEGRAGAGAEWWARECVRDAGGLGDTAEAQAVAGAMAENTAQRLRREAAALNGLAERFVWVNSANAFFDLWERQVVPADLFDTHPDVLDVVPVGRSGEKRARNLILNNPKTVRVAGLTRAVGQDAALVDVKDGKGAVRRMANTWQPSVWAGRQAKRQPVEWLELLEHVIPDAGYRTWFVCWLAWLFQRPGQRLLTIPLIVGGQGIGKDAILTAIKILLGHHNIQSLSMGQIGGQFTQWMLADLVILPELKLSGDGKMYNQIKDWMANAEEWVQINEKFQRPYTTRVTFSMISMTNHLDALPGLEADDRRWQVYVSEAKPAGQAFYDRVVDGSKSDEALAGLLDYLLNVDLSGFTAFTPAPGATDAKRAMMADTLKGAAQWAYQSLQPGGRFFGRHVLTIAEVEEAALSADNNRVRGTTDAHHVRAGLRAARWESLGRVRNGQERASYWISPELRTSPFIDAMAPKDFAAAYAAERNQHRQKILSTLPASN